MAAKKKSYPYLKTGDLIKIAGEFNISYDRVRHIRRGDPRYNDHIIKMTLKKLNDLRKQEAMDKSLQAASKIVNQ